MRLDNVTKFSVDVISQYRNDDDPEFAIMKLKFLSDGYNTHGLIFPTEILKRDVNTIKGKWVVAKYNQLKKDAEGHEKDEVIVGIIPNDAVITFEESDNGLFACVDAIISKLYAHDIIQMFKDINHRAVSIEALMEHEDNDQSKPVSRFVITGVTILGIDVKESCKGACCEIVKFSEDKAQEFYKQKFSEDEKIDVIDETSIETEKEVDSQSMAKTEKKDENIVMDKESLEEVKDEKVEALAEQPKEEEPQDDEEKMAEQPSEEPQEEKMEEEPKEEEKMEVEEPQDKEDEKEDMSCKCAELEAKLSEKEDVIKAQEVELAELREFKSKVQEAEKLSVVTTTLAKVKDIMDAELYAKFEESSKEYSLESITAWKNEVLASVTENVLQMSSKQVEDDVMRVEIPQETEAKSKGLWD